MAEKIEPTEKVTTTPAAEQVKEAPVAAAAPATEAKATETKVAEVTNNAKEGETKVDPKAAAPAEAKVDDKKVADDKTVVPEKYELKLSKDSPLDASHVAKIEAEAKAAGLTNEQAQSLLTRDEKVRSDFFQGQVEAAKQQQKLWVDEVTNDKEIGGKDFTKNVELAKRAMAKFADDSFRKVLDESGLGNNPHLIRTFLRIGKQMAEDKLVTDGKAGAASQDKKSRASKLYPTMKKTEE